MILKKYFGSVNFNLSTLKIALPLMLQQLISNSITLVINLMIGGLGDNALAGVAAVNRFFMISSYGTNGAISASSVFIAQFYGAKNRKSMVQAFRFACLASIIVMGLSILPALLIPRTIISFIVKDPLVIVEGMKYIRIAALSFIPNMISLPIIAAMRATGDSKTPLYSGILSFAANVLLNFCLVYGNFGLPSLGLLGGALSLLIARAFELTFLLIALNRVDYAFKTSVKDLLNIPKSLSKRMFSKMIPLTVSEIFWAIGLALLLKFYGTRGSDVVTGYSIASTVSDLFFTMNAGMSVCATILIAQPLGANQLSTAKKNGYNLLGFAILMSCLFSVLMFATSFIIPSLYGMSEASESIAISFLKIMSLFFSIYVLNTSHYCILRAGGDMTSTMILESGHMWLVNLTAVGFATYYTNLTIIPLYIIGQCTDLVKLAIAHKLVKREKWLVSLAHQSYNESLLEEIPSL